MHKLLLKINIYIYKHFCEYIICFHWIYIFFSSIFFISSFIINSILVYIYFYNVFFSSSDSRIKRLFWFKIKNNSILIFFPLVKYISLFSKYLFFNCSTILKKSFCFKLLINFTKLFKPSKSQFLINKFSICCLIFNLSISYSLIYKSIFLFFNLFIFPYINFQLLFCS